MNGRYIPRSMGILFLALFVLPLSGADLSVEYLEGVLEYREGQDTWIGVDIGESIPDGRTVRLSSRGYAELSAGAQIITLTRDGVYETANLVSKEPEKANFRDVLGSKFSALLNRPDASSGMTVAAVRGAEAEGDDFITWEDETTDYLSDGIALFEDGDIVGARNLFDEGTIWETGAIQRECAYRLGLCQQLLGDPRGARQTLSGINPEPDDPFFGEYTVTMGTLYIESREFDKADVVLSSYLDENPRGDAAQAAWLLSAFSLDGQGNSAGRSSSLRNAVELDPNSEIGRAAAQMLR
ncbi:MAG: hypothetical protein RQ801_09040 [Spirochaetaceae bacterium]|nr:hypothetical protein [Spirochaetaceae bacterium]MDT8298430.1 hypothetical protein [Spirochaetaceae bacterium]